MTTTINASTSSGLVVTPDNSGNVLLQYNGVAAPAFSAYAGSTQSLTGGASTKIQLNTEFFDTANYFDSSTNYRFTPLVAGYYQFNAAVRATTTTGELQLSIYKNGASLNNGSNTSGANIQTVASALIYLNGSTDYVELYCYVTNTATTASGYQSTYFQGCLLRGA